MVVQLRLVLEINKRQTKGQGLHKGYILIRHNNLYYGQPTTEQ